MTLPMSMHEPVITEAGLFQIQREGGTSSEINVHAGDLVDPDTSIGTASSQSGRPVTMNLARDLGVEPNSVTRFLTKPVGSHFQEGETLARARRGLRTVTSKAPVTGALSELDGATGVATLTPETDAVNFQALVYGEVVTVLENRGAIVRAAGSRLRGALGIGPDVYGRLTVAVDRHDRELTPDGITEALRDGIALGGMTVGASAIRRLVEVGARGVIVGSIAETDVRRALATGNERSARSFWQVSATGSPLPPDLRRAPLTIFATEGFGRRPMAAPIFSFLAEREDQEMSLFMPNEADGFPAYPYLYITSRGADGDDSLHRASPADGVMARLVDPQHLGTVVVCRSGVFPHRRRDGVSVYAVDVEFSNGVRRFVSARNLEILTAG